MVEERSLIEASGRTQVCVRNRYWNVHLGIQLFYCAGESDSDQWTGNVPSRHFFLGSVLVPTHVVYSKLRGFTKDSLLASLSPFTLFSKTGAGTLPEDLDSTPLHLSTKKEAKQQFGMPCLKGPIPQGTRIQVVSSVSMSPLAPDAEGKASVPTPLYVPHRQIRAALGARGRMAVTLIFCIPFPSMLAGRLGSYLALANSPQTAAVRTLQHANPAGTLPSATSVKPGFQFECLCWSDAAQKGK